jgi:hypothetical protein
MFMRPHTGPGLPGSAPVSAALTLVVDGDGHVFVAAPGFSQDDVARILRTTADWYAAESSRAIAYSADADPVAVYPGDATDEDITTALRRLQLVPAAAETYWDPGFCHRVRQLTGWLSATLEHRCRRGN